MSADGFRIGQIVRRTSGAGYYAVLANRASTTRVRNCATGRECVINSADLAGTSYPDDPVIASMFTATDY